MFGKIFGTETTEKVLLYLQSYEEGYATAIADTFGISLNLVQRQLLKLEAEGPLSASSKDEPVSFFGILGIHF